MSKKLAAFGVLAALWCAAVTVSSAQQPTAGETKVWDGVFTSAQAARGKAPFERSCARCHNVELAGSQRGPALKGNVFWVEVRERQSWDAVQLSARQHAAGWALPRRR